MARCPIVFFFFFEKESHGAMARNKAKPARAIGLAEAMITTYCETVCAKR